MNDKVINKNNKNKINSTFGSKLSTLNSGNSIGFDVGILKFLLF